MTYFKESSTILAGTGNTTIVIIDYEKCSIVSYLEPPMPNNKFISDVGYISFYNLLISIDTSDYLRVWKVNEEKIIVEKKYQYFIRTLHILNNNDILIVLKNSY